MPPVPLLVAETRAWLAKADEDLRACEACLALRRPSLSTLVWHSVPFRKTHQLIEIAEPSWRLDGTLRAQLEAVLPLSQYAWKHRYPGEPLEPTREEAALAIRLAQVVHTAILARLPGEVAPDGLNP